MNSTISYIICCLGWFIKPYFGHNYVKYFGIGLYHVVMTKNNEMLLLNTIIHLSLRYCLIIALGYYLSNCTPLHDGIKQ